MAADWQCVLSVLVGLPPARESIDVKGFVMSTLVAIAVAAGLAVYLAIALLFPEKFS